VRALDAPEKSKERKDYEKRIKELQAQVQRGDISPDGLLSLSAYQIVVRERLDPTRGYVQAIDTLRLAEARNPEDFRVPANLATAYFLLGQHERAVYYQEKAIKALAGRCPGWPSAKLQWMRRVEGCFLKYLYERLEETRRPPGRTGDELAPLTNALFPGVRFVGPDGGYPLGQLAPAQEARLPADAVAVVEQLLLWLPHDPDLKIDWLLAELLNARGDVIDAATLLDDLIFNRRFSAREAQRHRRILIEAKETALLAKDGRLACWLTPRGVMAPGANSYLNEELWFAVLTELKRRQSPTGNLETTGATEEAKAPPAAEPPERHASKQPPEYQPDLPRLLIGGGVLLVVVALLAYLQGYLAGRRRQRALVSKD
jgi:tetratricopeptide (TPR) repeat protein